ncbi:MAG: hypothetical protein ACE5GE_00725 [Phycisphaerae bacterium]
MVGLVGLLAICGAGCNPNATLFSDTFRNFTSGDVVPLTPGPASELVMVRLINETNDAVEFVVTAERQVLVVDDQGVPVIQSTDETVRLLTLPVATANEVGALFDCPVTRIGLGEDIDRPFTDSGLFVLDAAAISGVQQGFGVPSNLLPLDSRSGNFGCGDTVVIRAILSQGDVGNLKVQSFVLPFASQPTEFVGPHTFNNVRLFLEEQVLEDN